MTLIGCHYDCNIADNMGTLPEKISLKNISCAWGQHGAHLGPVGPRWTPCWPHEPCYQGYDLIQCCSSPAVLWIPPGCVEGLSQLLASVQVYYTLRQRQNGRHFTDDIFKCIILNENVWILIKISLKFVPWGPINNKTVLIQTMAWCRPGDKALSETMMVSLLTHICVTWPEWVV